MRVMVRALPRLTSDDHSDEKLLHTLVDCGHHRDIGDKRVSAFLRSTKTKLHEGHREEDQQP